MKLLLDTHTLLWWAHEPDRLSGDAYKAIQDGENQVFVSAVSAMEIATKNRKGKLEYDTALAGRFVAEVTNSGFGLVPIKCEHAERAGSYESMNQDPWDRLLVAQAQIEGLQLISKDSGLPDFGVNIFW